jgi:hypothetical protein
VAPRLNSEVIARRLGDGAVLVHLPTSRIFELNDTAMRVWELLEEGLDAAGIEAHLATEYDTSAQAASQVAQLLDLFRHEGLIA